MALNNGAAGIFPAQKPAGPNPPPTVPLETASRTSSAGTIAPGS